MGCRFGGYPVENLAHFCGLVFGPFADGGAATDSGILLFDFGGAAAGDKGAEVGLEASEGDEIGVGLYRSVWQELIGSSDAVVTG